MKGAIIGDIIGSRFEWANVKSKEFELFTKDSRFTDDSVCQMNWKMFILYLVTSF